MVVFSKAPHCTIRNGRNAPGAPRRRREAASVRGAATCAGHARTWETAHSAAVHPLLPAGPPNEPGLEVRQVLVGAGAATPRERGAHNQPNHRDATPLVRPQLGQQVPDGERHLAHRGGRDRDLGGVRVPPVELVYHEHEGLGRRVLYVDGLAPGRVQVGAEHYRLGWRRGRERHARSFPRGTAAAITSLGQTSPW